MEKFIGVGFVLVIIALVFVKSQITLPRVGELQSDEVCVFKASNRFCLEGITFEWIVISSGEILKRGRIRCSGLYRESLEIRAPKVTKPMEVELKVELANPGILQVITSTSRIYTISPAT